jgi:LysM repeat protein
VWRAPAAVVAGLLLAACGKAGTDAATRLEVDAAKGSPNTVLQPSQATLTCDGTPTGTGFLRDHAGEACALVHDGVIQRVAAAQSRPRECAQIYGGPQHARITGTIDGDKVDLTVTRADSCGTHDWEILQPLLGDPEGGPAAAPAAPTTTAPPAPTSYVVKRGDTLVAIAKQFGVAVGAIVFVNGLEDPDKLAEGTTLIIPPRPPVQLTVTPTDGPPGSSFALELGGAQPSENVRFQIDSPAGTYTGPPHTATAAGVVRASYQSASDDVAGVYSVVARGDRGTTAQAVFRIGTQ